MSLKKILAGITIAGLLVVLTSWLMWLNTPEKVLRVAIIDKTVATPERLEHRCFNWILTHNKYVKSNKQTYSTNDDYFGFFPLEPLENERYKIKDFEAYNSDEIKKISDTLDMIYITDTYGVYYNEWYKDSLKSGNITPIYGGMSENEMLLLEEMKASNKLILCEFNLLEPPTKDTVRKRFEKAFDLEWSKWTGRNFPSLDSANNEDLPPWLVKLYMQQNRNKWPFKNSGIVFVHTDNTIVVLENKTHLKLDVPVIKTNRKNCARFGVTDSIIYPFWFDIIIPHKSYNIVSNMQIITNSKGDSILKSHNIPNTFPATIEHLADYRFYYFAGDYTDNPMPYETRFFKGIKFFDFMFYDDKITSRTKFFWKYYLPLLETILDENFKNN